MAQQKRPEIGDNVRVKARDITGKIVEDNGHAYKLCGVWFHEDEVVKEMLGARTFVVSMLTGQFKVGPLDEFDNVHALKNLICIEKDLRAVQLSQGGEKLPSGMKLIDIPPDAELFCIAVAPAIVLDCGSSTSRAGFSGDDAPLVEIPSIVGRPKCRLAGTDVPDVLVGDEAKLKRGILHLKYPIEHGLVTDWDNVVKIWHHIFYNELRVDPSEHNLLLTEPPLNPKANRERTLQVMFEQFDVHSMHMADKTALSLYSVGRVTGIVVDIGKSVRYIVPMYEGCPLLHAVERYDRDCGGDLTDRLARHLTETGQFCATTSAEQEVVQIMKEAVCYVAIDFDTELKEAHAGNRDCTYELPGGRVINIGAERFRCTEALFNPYLDYKGKFYRAGLHDNVFNVITKCDVDIRNALYSNIILSGGSSMVCGIAERLDKELRTLAPSGMHIEVLAPPERKYSSWIGGSILSSLDTFKDMWLPKEEFEENGPDAAQGRGF